MSGVLFARRGWSFDASFTQRGNKPPSALQFDKTVSAQAFSDLSCFTPMSVRVADRSLPRRGEGLWSVRGQGVRARADPRARTPLN